MSRPLAVLRPEPGATATVERILAAGHHALRLPLFHVEQRAWPPAAAADHDALVLTSANAVRHAGPQLAGLRALPVWAVGDATAAAATAAGLTVVATGTTGAAALLDRAWASGIRRALWLGGESLRLDGHPAVTRILAVYASAPTAPDAQAVRHLSGSVVLVHSPRAARALRLLLDAYGIPPSELRLAAISSAAAEAAGPGWGAIEVAAVPTDPVLVAAAIRLAD
ncbi:uroporphyrinogen-III synthase [Sphingomonas sp. PL-96]|uniref:uroporphyrinogen-III synthase n=1 Tax=Sphingomonas sp. PL-96 TaxID=2887201 RepID=UPI001E2EBAEF|nr:uroporphyrinogen-III synthase [Sphingomonas sp. PL-96]MCC2977693.1 uroporphyrinogen-III synthase [Sphingomonas sp. PL-96]